ncbi:transposase [Streptomyces sp. NPDC001750]|uniref:transposase n=1 Tax=Streptomyces sp. NPDC001750 TaxID=3364607 RepID=UPI0036AEAB59
MSSLRTFPLPLSLGIANCQVGVSLHLARDHASTAVNWRLFLSRTWDPASLRPIRRRPHAAPPAGFRRCRSRGEVAAGPGHARWDPLVGDRGAAGSRETGYGDAAAFRHGLQARGLNYVVGISTTLSVQPGEAVSVAEPYSGTGRPLAEK